MGVLAGAIETEAELLEVIASLEEALRNLRKAKRDGVDASDQRRASHGRDYSRAPYVPPWTGQGLNPQGFGESGPNNPNGGGGG